MNVPAYRIPNLPLAQDLENRSVLRKTNAARAALAELKGVTGIVPNQNILINTLSLQEAMDSSAIESIITTHDELYRSDNLSFDFASPAAKEVHKYAETLKKISKQIESGAPLTNNVMAQIQRELEGNNAGFRAVPGTVLKNDRTGEIVYEPPQSPEAIKLHMNNLEQYINTPGDNLDPLVRMAVIHHQFESIHPFYDGNGRTGRIVNILYLLKEDLLDSPVLYLSRYINMHKDEYYAHLQSVRTNGTWEEWIYFMLDAVEETSRQTIVLIRNIKDIMQHHKILLRRELPKIYSQDLLNNLFFHPYTKIEFVMRDLQVHRNTAVKYLEHLVNLGIVSKIKMGRENFYLNDALYNLLKTASKNIRSGSTDDVRTVTQTA